MGKGSTNEWNMACTAEGIGKGTHMHRYYHWVQCYICIYTTHHVCVNDFKPAQDTREPVGGGVGNALCVQGLRGEGMNREGREGRGGRGGEGRGGRGGREGREGREGRGGRLYLVLIIFSFLPSMKRSL